MSCSICSESYQNSEEICSTVCGHIFHFSCLRQWQQRYDNGMYLFFLIVILKVVLICFRSDTCPLCNKSNPQPHRIYLDLKEDAPAPSKINNPEDVGELIIKGLRPNQILYPLKRTIMMLVDAMNLSTIKEGDIKSVLRTGNNICLTFKRNEHRATFLKNSKSLKTNPQTKLVKVHELLDEATEDLFKYCHKLKQKGYKIVFVNNNKVYVKKQSNGKPINILSKEQVDTLFKSVEQAENSNISRSLQTRPLTSSRRGQVSPANNQTRPSSAYVWTENRNNSRSLQTRPSSSNVSTSNNNYQQYVDDYDDYDDYGYNDYYRPNYYSSPTPPPPEKSNCTIC